MEFNKVEAYKWMHRNIKEHIDPKTGEVNCTSLAEACAAHFEVNDEGGPLDDESHWIWDLAAVF